MIYVARKTFRCIQRLTLVVAMCIPFASSATTVKALSFAINEPNGSGDRTPIKAYMAENDVDFGAFDYAKAPSYFINADYSQDGKNYKVDYYSIATSHYKFFVWNSDKYELVSTPSDDKSSDNMTAVFQDEFGDQYALISVRGTYKDDKVSATLGPVKTYIEGIATKYPNAKLIVTYNARLSGTYSTTGNTYMDILDSYLTANSSGPQMTCLGRVTDVGGFYMYPADTPSAYSVVKVPSSIGTKYSGSLAEIDFPSKYKVIFTDWDGTVIQTNIVAAGGSVTPPTPVREGYAFIGWDHPASDFESVTESFTATAQYDVPTLTVLGEPEDIGTADPAYGTITTIASNDSFTASVAMPNVEPDATERWVCTGYTHYQITDIDTGARTVVQQGNDMSFAYTHVWRDEIVWHFTNEWLVAVSATAGGSVSAGDTWVRNAETLALVAMPDEGWEFLGWVGDTNGIADVTVTTISPAVTAARSLRAVFIPTGADASVQYVATTGDDANSGYSAESPKLTIQAAVDTLADAAGHGTVFVAPGRYQTSNSVATAVSDGAKASVVVTNAIAVVGDGESPEDVVVRNTSTYNQAQVIVFYLNHPDALVANLTAENGHRNAPASPFGSNVSIDSRGGTVSNCVLRGGVSIGNYVRGTAAWLNSADALLTHCVVTNNSAPGNGYQTTIGGGKGLYGGLFVHVDNGTVANCLIANNRDSSGWAPGGQDKQSWSSGVTVREGCLLNCSIVTNEARYTAGVYLHPNGYATNVVVAGCVNKCSYTNSLGQIGWSDIGFKGTLDNASHCASDGGEELDSTCIAGTAAEFFLDMAGRDYRPAKNSPLINKGVAYEGIASFDLLGKKRVQGRVPDIGAYETAPRHMIVCIR